MYIIQEIQTENNQTTLLNPITKNNINEAESVYHGIMASAAISEVDVHTAIIYDEHGNIIMKGFYEHINVDS